MKAEIKVIEYGDNIRKDIRAGGKTVQLTLDTGERVYRWEQFFNYEEVSLGSWERAYEYAVTKMRGKHRPLGRGGRQKRVTKLLEG